MRNHERIRSLEREQLQGFRFGVFVPDAYILNKEIEGWGLTDKKGNTINTTYIYEKTGIKKRHVATQNDYRNENQFYMGAHSLHKAMRGRKSLDAYFVTNSYPMNVNLSTVIPEALGVRVKGIPDLKDPEVPWQWRDGRVEVGAACTGFAHILSFIKKHEGVFWGREIGITATEKYSTSCVNLKELGQEGVERDPSLSQILFSDGAVSMVATYGKDFRILSTAGRSKESQDVLMPIEKDRIQGNYLYKKVPTPPRDEWYFQQNGRRVINFILSEVPSLIEEVVEKAKINPDEIKAVFPHQPSKQPIEGLSKKIDLPIVADYEKGNWSSASIPKSLEQAFANGVMSVGQGGEFRTTKLNLRKGDKIVIAGFGAGVQAEAAVLEL